MLFNSCSLKMCFGHNLKHYQLIVVSQSHYHNHQSTLYFHFMGTKMSTF